MTEKAITQPKPGDVIAENVPFEEFVKTYDGQPVEWHAGKVVVKVSNNESHQFILGLLETIINLYLMFKQIGRLYPDGYQMHLGDNVPARQPDLLVILNENQNRIQEQHIEGPADVVIEIISPSTGSVDRGDKFYEYQNGGVPEYWIIDPLRKEIDIYSLSVEGVYQRIVDTDGKIISKILPGFVLESSILWQDKLPDGDTIVNLVKAMVR